VRRIARIAIVIAGWPVLLSACALPFVSQSHPGPPAKPSGAWGAKADMLSRGFGPALALLPDGRVLAAGGGGFRTAFADAEAYDGQHNTWSAIPSLPAARGEHTATALGDGSVLVAGGLSANNQTLATADLFLPNGTWISAGPMSRPRFGHQAFLLADGRVLLIGGASEVANLGQVVPTIKTVDIFDPNTRRFMHGPAAPGPVQGSMLARLPDGRLLMAGGDDPTRGSVSSVWLYDAHINAWTAAHAMPTSLAYGIAVTLGSGKVLVAGGDQITPQSSGGGGQPFAGSPPAPSKSALVYDPVANSWSKIADSPAGIAQGFGGSLLLADERVLIFGVNFGAGLVTVSGVFYDPATGAWSSAPPTPVRLNGGGMAVLLRSGKVLLILDSGSVLFDPEATPPQPVEPPVHPLASPQLTPWLTLTAGLLLLILAAQFARAQLVSRARH
jgi:hypothetical protein